MAQRYLAHEARRRLLQLVAASDGKKTLRLPFDMELSCFTRAEGRYESIRLAAGAEVSMFCNYPTASTSHLLTVHVHDGRPQYNVLLDGSVQEVIPKLPGQAHTISRRGTRRKPQLISALKM